MVGIGDNGGLSGGPFVSESRDLLLDPNASRKAKETYVAPQWPTGSGSRCMRSTGRPTSGGSSTTSPPNTAVAGRQIRACAATRGSSSAGSSGNRKRTGIIVLIVLLPSRTRRPRHPDTVVIGGSVTQGAACSGAGPRHPAAWRPAPRPLHRRSRRVAGTDFTGPGGRTRRGSAATREKRHSGGGRRAGQERPGADRKTGARDSRVARQSGHACGSAIDRAVLCSPRHPFLQNGF
jgi:hypothetical protein